MKDSHDSMDCDLQQTWEVRQPAGVANWPFHGTVLMAAHDRTFIDRYATSIWSVADGTVRRCTDLFS